METQITATEQVKSNDVEDFSHTSLEKAYQEISFVEPGKSEKKNECVNNGCCRRS